jgi:hypothetical protein
MIAGHEVNIGAAQPLHIPRWPVIFNLIPRYSNPQTFVLQYSHFQLPYFPLVIDFEHSFCRQAVIGAAIPSAQVACVTLGLCTVSLSISDYSWKYPMLWLKREPRNLRCRIISGITNIVGIRKTLFQSDYTQTVIHMLQLPFRTLPLHLYLTIRLYIHAADWGRIMWRAPRKSGNAL